MLERARRSTVVFVLGVLGVLFYAAAPMLFPDVPAARQPELLPVYTLMMGLGELIKNNEKKDKESDAGPSED